MNTYKRDIKFCYYKVVYINEEGKLLEKFNLVEWLMKMQDEGQVKRNIQLSDCSVHLEDFDFVDNNSIYCIRAFKLRDANIPSKVKDGKESTPIPLDDDEYIGEDLNFLYDRENSVCMLQQNRMSIGVSRLVEWINRDFERDGKKVAFMPISGGFQPNKIGKRKIRKLEFSFANLVPEEPDGSLGSLINSLGKYKGVNGKIIIGCGYDRNAELDKANIIDLVDELQTNPGIVKTGKITLRQDGMLDDDKAHLEVVDIFEDSLNNVISFEIEKRKPLDFGQAKVKMLAAYKKRYSELCQMCKW